MFFAPESPWWLIRKERYEEAEKALARLSIPSPLVKNPEVRLYTIPSSLQLYRL